MADAPTAWASRRYRPVDYDRGPGRRRTGVRVLADACWRRRMAPMQAADRRWALVDCRARWRRRAVRVPRQDEFPRNAMPVRVERSVAAPETASRQASGKTRRGAGRQTECQYVSIPVGGLKLK